jgi:uncharacterized protein YegP (UPF0339 family)
MIQINKLKSGQYSVSNVASNGELLKASETFKSKAACWGNIKSEMKNCYESVDVTWGDDEECDCGSFVKAIVQDNTGKKPVVYSFAGTNKVVSARNPQKIYVPKSVKTPIVKPKNKK